MPQYSYNLIHHSHGNHSHFNLKKEEDLPKKHNHSHEDGANCKPCEHKNSKITKKIGKTNEGCPCCLASIDLDEVATALHEISSKGVNIEANKRSLGELADFSSGAHWGIVLGIVGPLALVGLTASYRNIKGTLNNLKDLKTVINGLEQDIAGYKKRMDNASGKEKDDLSGVIQRLEAFGETLKYSKFDTKCNLIVPGFINGVASTIVLSSAIISSPWALPVIALYAGCQTTRSSYDLWRTWNIILPKEVREKVELNMHVGIRKINQITDSKRKFYAANTLGFAIFTAGAIITTTSALSVVGSPGVAVGIPLLAVGAVSTGITNNIWTNKFRPRNGDLGIDRKALELEQIKWEIGERREVKKLLKNYKDKHLPNKSSNRFGCSLLSSLPFCNEKGQKLLHKVNKSRISESKSSDEDRLDLLERAINTKIVLKKAGNQKETDPLLKRISGLEKISEAEKVKFGLVSFDKKKPPCEQIFESLENLGVDTIVLDKFIKNAILKPLHNHDTSIKSKTDYFQKLTDSGLFTINDNKVAFNPQALEEKPEMKKTFMNSLEECLLFDYVDKLTYEQYGLNDFYWALDKQNKKQPQQNKKQSHLQDDEPLDPNLCTPCDIPNQLIHNHHIRNRRKSNNLCADFSTTSCTDEECTHRPASNSQTVAGVLESAAKDINRRDIRDNSIPNINTTQAQSELKEIPTLSRTNEECTHPPAPNSQTVARDLESATKDINRHDVRDNSIHIDIINTTQAQSELKEIPTLSSTKEECTHPSTSNSQTVAGDLKGDLKIATKDINRHDVRDNSIPIGITTTKAELELGADSELQETPKNLVQVDQNSSKNCLMSLIYSLTSSCSGGNTTSL